MFSYLDSLPSAARVLIGALLTSAALALVVLTSFSLLGAPASVYVQASSYLVVSVLMAVVAGPSLLRSVRLDSDSRSDFVSVTAALLATVLLVSFATGLPRLDGFIQTVFFAGCAFVTVPLLSVMAAGLVMVPRLLWSCRTSSRMA